MGAKLSTLLAVHGLDCVVCVIQSKHEALANDKTAAPPDRRRPLFRYQAGLTWRAYCSDLEIKTIPNNSGSRGAWMDLAMDSPLTGALQLHLGGYLATVDACIAIPPRFRFSSLAPCSDLRVIYLLSHSCSRIETAESAVWVGKCLINHAANSRQPAHTRLALYQPF